MSTQPEPQVPRRRWRMQRSGALAFALLVSALGVFAPLLANDVPLAACVQGRWSFPAFADLVGKPPVGPDDLSWKRWAATLPTDSPDRVYMPPWPNGPIETNRATVRQAPSWAHPMGTDDTGRDVLSRLLHGAGSFVWLAIPAVLLGGVIGTLLGALAGMRRGLVDVVILRLIELFACFPMLLFLLFAAAFLGDSRIGLVVVMASIYWTSFARIVRGELLSLLERDYVFVARGFGVSERRLFLGHLLPQIWTSIAITAAFCAASAAVADSTLSFLGLGSSGVPSSWGEMLRQGVQHAAVGAWHLWLFPSLALIAVVVCCHQLADRLRCTTADQ